MYDRNSLKPELVRSAESVREEARRLKTVNRMVREQNAALREQMRASMSRVRAMRNGEWSVEEAANDA
jgi:hypothetical protein